VSLRNLFEDVLREVNVTEVDSIELLRGTTRVPFVQQSLMSISGMGKLNRTMNSDEAIATGAEYIAMRVSDQFENPAGTSIRRSASMFRLFCPLARRSHSSMRSRMPMKRSWWSTRVEHSVLFARASRCRSSASMNRQTCHWFSSWRSLLSHLCSGRILWHPWMADVVDVDGDAPQPFTVSLRRVDLFFNREIDTDALDGADADGRNQSAEFSLKLTARCSGKAQGTHTRGTRLSGQSSRGSVSREREGGSQRAILAMTVHCC
jgi:hypothetical protein